MHGKNSVGLWLCLACGRQKEMLNNNAKRSISCGCVKTVYKTHGESKTLTYRRWLAMRRRCDTPSTIQWHNYGGRGIKVCPEWSSYIQFKKDMGIIPGKQYTIERRDVNGNYEPENCYWELLSKQALNTTKTRYFKIGQAVLSIHELAALFNKTSKQILKRIYRGWKLERALTQEIK